MFIHDCTSCHRTELIFPSQITGLDTTAEGFALTFTCWCEAPQTMITTNAATRRDLVPA